MARTEGENFEQEFELFGLNELTPNAKDQLANLRKTYQQKSDVAQITSERQQRFGIYYVQRLAKNEGLRREDLRNRRFPPHKK